VNLLQRIRGWFSPLSAAARRSGVQRSGRDSLRVTIAGRSYWVHARFPETPGGEYVVWISNVRDITSAPTVVAAPPAAEPAIPEVKRRISQFVAAANGRVRYQ
jgi:hypothetical protein